MVITKQGRGRPRRSAIYTALDVAVAELRQIGGLPEADLSQAIWAAIWYEESHNSTAIEGNTLKLKEVQRLLMTGEAVGAKELAEYNEVKGYGDAAQWVYAQASDSEIGRDDPYITLTELRQIHRLVVEAAWTVKPPEGLLPEEGPGSFRRHDIEAFPEGMVAPPFTQVPALVSDWLQLANSEPQQDQPLPEHLAKVHNAFERIHPFRDGNGRTGRLALNLLLIRHGLAPAIIYKRDRTKYLKVMRRADRGDYGPLGELLARATKDCLDRFLLPAVGGPHQTLPLSALAGRSVTALALRRAAERGALKAIRRETGWYSTKHAVEQYLESRKGGRRRRIRSDTASS